MGGETDGVVGENGGPSGEGDADGNGEAPLVGGPRRGGWKRSRPEEDADEPWRRRRSWSSERGSKAATREAASERKASTPRERGTGRAREAAAAGR